MIIRKLIPTVLLAIAVTPLVSLPAAAGADRVAFPENWDKGVLYGTVDRVDIKLTESVAIASC